MQKPIGPPQTGPGGYLGLDENGRYQHAAAVFDYPSADANYRYVTIAYDWGELGIVDLVILATPKAIGDCWQRGAWMLVEREPPAEKHNIVIVAAPELLVLRPPPDFERHAFIPPRYMFDIIVMRVESARMVPQTGEPIRLGSLMGQSEDAVYERVRSYSHQQSPLPDASFAVDPCRLDLARVVRQPASAEVRHVDGDWSITLQPEDPWRPVAYHLKVEPHPEADKLGARSAFLVQVAHTRNTQVSARQLMSIAERVEVPYQAILFRVLRDYLAAQDRQAKSIVELRTALLDESAIGFDGLDIGRAQYKDAPLEIMFSAEAALLIDVVLTGVEMIPVVGSVFEFGHLAYCAVTGYDIMGRKVSQSDLALMGIFAVIGILPGVPTVSPSLLGKLGETGAKLSQKLGGVPVQLVTANPGSKATLLRLLGKAATPTMREAVEQVSEHEVPEMIEMLIKAADGQIALREALQFMAGKLMPHLRDLPMVENIPQGIFMDALGAVPPSSMSFASKYGLEPAASALDDVYYAALRAGDPAELRRYIQRQFGSEAWNEYIEAIRGEVVWRVFDINGGFRTPAMNESFWRELLEGGYSGYRAGKLAAGVTARDALEWAMRQTKKTRFHMALQMELGPLYKGLLDPAWLRKLARDYTVSAKQAKVYAEFVKGSLSRVGPSIAMPYREMRRVLTKTSKEIGERLGHLFESDHVFEARFFRQGEIEGLPIHSADYIAILVPKNATVALALSERGVTGFLYTHARKTALAKKYLPYGKESKFTAQEIYNAYYHIYVHEFGWPGDFFRDLLGDVFSEVARMRGEKFVAQQLDEAASSLEVNRALRRVEAP